MKKTDFRLKLSDAQRYLMQSLVFLSIVILSGIVGYSLIENLSLLDSFYMTIITITTTGFREVQPLSSAGKLFTIMILISGFSSLAYAAGRGAQYLFEYGLFRRRKMKNLIEKLKDHTIICGFGRMGKEICRMLYSHKAPFIVIEQDDDAIHELMGLEYAFVHGNANEDNFLEMAGIHRAQAVISVLSSDADNVYTVLTARGLNPNLQILARAISESSQSKLLKAGADKVILPYLLGGRRIANSLLRPEIMDFFQLLEEENDFDVQMESVTLNPTSELVNLDLASTFIRSDLDIIVVMIVRDDKSIVYNPGGNTTLKTGDKLIAIGHHDKLKILENIAIGK